MVVCLFVCSQLRHTKRVLLVLLDNMSIEAGRRTTDWCGILVRLRGRHGPRLNVASVRL